MNFANYSKTSTEIGKSEISSPPALAPKLNLASPPKRPKIEPKKPLPGEEKPQGGQHEVVIEEGPVVHELEADHADEHDDEDLEEDEDETCLSAAQLLRKHRAAEFNEHDFDEEYY